MRIIGPLLLLIGAILIIAGMQTSSGAAPADRLLITLVGSTGFIAGVLLYGFGTLAELMKRRNEQQD